jgi:peptidoglycan/xylan/chitin deacetylase (PgdA/CDA1 family)
MSRRAKFWQQLLQLRHHTTDRLRAFLGAWHGLLTGVLVLILLAAALLFLARTSAHVSAKGPSPSILAQIATRTATRKASATVVVTATIASSSRGAPLPTVKPTLPWSPFATATQVAASPLLIETATPMQVVALPTQLVGPDIAPVEIKPIQPITTSPQLSETPPAEPLPASPVAATITASLLPTVTPTAATNVVVLLEPTVTPTPTQSIIEALQQPVAHGGMAAIVATATALAPPVEQAPADEPTPAEYPTVTEAEAPAADVASPTPTVFIQPTPDGNVRSAYVPILMYHYLSVPPADADAIRLDLSVTPDLFSAQLDAMQQAGYTTISLYALLDNLTNGTPLPDKPVIITFDDGYRDAYTDALPILRAHGMTATFFIVPDFIDGQYPAYLTWDMVREMYAAGMSIEGHGRNHVSLANKDHDYLIWQALGSYEAIQRELGVRPHFLAYPAGEYDQNTIDIIRSANFWAAVTSKQGASHRSDGLFELTRVRVHGTTTPQQLLSLLSIDW